jgi:hypothetical protein
LKRLDCCGRIGYNIFTFRNEAGSSSQSQSDAIFKSQFGVILPSLTRITRIIIFGVFCAVPGLFVENNYRMLKCFKPRLFAISLNLSRRIGEDGRVFTRFLLGPVNDDGEIANESGKYEKEKALRAVYGIHKIITAEYCI